MLIADSGSTKTEWCVLAPNGNTRIKTQGISPYFLNTKDICKLLENDLLPQIADPKKINAIYYYGTGCTAPVMNKIVEDALVTLFPSAKINIAYDLVAAAHALCGKSKGIACVLGTGSSSGYYNGSEIERDIPGLGYILGDEGSGAYLGKLLCTSFLYGRLDEKLSLDFSSAFKVSKDSLLEKIYSSPHANRLLASFSIFLSENRSHPMIEAIIKRGLGDFFSVHISSYTESKKYPVHFTGSIAWHYADMIRVICDEYGFECGKIIKEPMDGLLEYHASGLR
jgi:N-acetylglucosamine kinase-like BadF-type ATPase